jgi:uncharacterized protein
MKQRESRTALITGASSGIGAAFARQLASKDYNLVLVARREEKLATLADNLQRQYAMVAEYVVTDLSLEKDIEQVENRINQLPDVEMLINNAGFGTMGNFAEIKLSKQIEMVQVHVIATMRLCRTVLPSMIYRNHGTIINVASIGAFLAAPGNATYNATKAFLTSFSESLQQELRSTNIYIQALCPGFTYTEFHNTEEYAHLNRGQIPKWLWSSADEVVRQSLDAVGQRPVTFIPGIRNQILVALLRNRLTALLLRHRTNSVLQQQSG